MAQVRNGEHRREREYPSDLLQGQGDPRGFQIARWLFLKALGLIFFIAFASLLVQLKGLIGANGILPAAELLAWTREQLGAERFLEVPTLFWLGASDGALLTLCAAGMLLSVLLVIGIAPRWTLLALWISYLSFASTSGIFLSYQWDVLLLETAVMALFLAPAALRPREAWGSPLWLGSIWLLRWLLLRLMVLSGLVKLLSGDETWRNLTALRFHYWTQPLPNVISFYVAHLPNFVQTGCTALMFVIELLVPWMMFVNRRLRFWTAVVLVAFQLAILLTGNYCFFNLLAVALCFVLLDDQQWARVLPERLALRLSAQPPKLIVPPPWVRWTRLSLAVGIVLVSIAEMRFWRRQLPAPIESLLAALQPFRSINSYGLFAVMTTTRPEILIDGSRDGKNWQTYEFKWKPGPLDRAAGWVAPHQPRLDWQMWFAALGSCRQNQWFLRFQKKLLEGAPEVLGLLKTNPFPDSPPKYVRALLYQYRVSDISEWINLHVFWKRQPEGAYCPILALEDGSLVVPSLR
jgi:hypothetical protein